MLIKRIMTMRFCLSFGVALAVAGVLAGQKSGPVPNPEGDGIVYVYFSSRCTAPGDPSDCREIRGPSRPGFASMGECWKHADRELRGAHDPRLMASCMKSRQS